MTLILSVMHVMVAVALILVVLFQPGGGADMGAAFGGSSQSVFGARGSGSFMGKVTAGLATLFMLTSLGLAFQMSSVSKSKSVMEAPIVDIQKQKPAASSADKPGLPIPGKTGVEEGVVPKSGSPQVAVPQAAMPSGDVMPTVAEDAIPVAPKTGTQ
ncbi:MAG: preprotein translocase subunit SecG [Magnetococcales bacterium]|nr:preprotein translocase subunit SecG [Magnetococcales bacterium]